MAIAAAQTPVGTFTNVSATTLAKAYGSNVTAGNLLVALVAWGAAGSTCTVSGSLNGAFTAIAGSLGTNVTMGFRAEIFFKQATSSGAETVTMTCSAANTDREIVVYELSGAATTGQPDSSHGANGSSTNPTDSITIVAQPGWIVSYGVCAAGTMTVGSGYTSDVSQNGDVAEHKAYSATGATSVPYVDATTGQWVVTCAAFTDAAGGGGGTTVKQLAALGVG